MAFYVPFPDRIRLFFRYLHFVCIEKRLRTNERVLANTTYGQVIGTKWHTVYGNCPYYSFEGIPFAQPPVGELRFKAPMEPTPWEGCKLCVHSRPKPCQYNLITKRMDGSEDCLYLNVYTRELEPAKPLPVLVWLCGGGFQMSDTSRHFFSPDYIMMENVVLVCVAYRVGPLGFLSLDDKSCDVPGNAGIKDQLLALTWVKNNCQFFGGDAQNITAIGESAGAASIHHLMMAKRAENLFHKAAMMSGTALNSWSLLPRLDWAYRLAKATGYKGRNRDEHVLAFLKTLNLKDMFMAADSILTKDEVMYEGLVMCFGPCVEPYKTEHCVIEQEPLGMLKNNWSNSIPLLIGGTSFEGLVVCAEVRKYPFKLNELDEAALPPADAGLTAEKLAQHGKRIKQAYFGNKKPSMKTLKHYCDLSSCKAFWHGIHRTLLARCHYTAAPTFLYRFDFDSELNLVRVISCGNKMRGTAHGDDTCYLFYNCCTKVYDSSSLEYKTIRRLVAMVAKFAEYTGSSEALSEANGGSSLNENAGAQCEKSEQCCSVRGNGIILNTFTNNEQIYWLPVEVGDGTKPFKCLNISNELKVIDLPEAEKLELWDSVYEDKSLLY